MSAGWTGCRSLGHTENDSVRDNINTVGWIRIPHTCMAGRTVAAVVWMAPETIPSASPRWTIMTPYLWWRDNQRGVGVSAILEHVDCPNRP